MDFESMQSDQPMREDRDLADLFERTRPYGPPVDVDGLRGELRGLEKRALEEERRGVPIQSAPRWYLLPAAAALLMAGLFVGWYAAHQSMQDAERRQNESFRLSLQQTLEDSLEGTRGRVLEEVGRILATDRGLLLDEQAVRLKEVALLLRRDYQREVASVRNEFSGLASACQSVHSAIPVSFNLNKKETSQ